MKRTFIRKQCSKLTLCRFGGSLATVLALAGCVTTGTSEDGPGQIDSAAQPVVGGAVAADDPQAALIGRQVLDAGGNAVDAAAAMAMAMAVTLPSRVGLGGGGVCLVHAPDAATVRVVDFLPRRTTGRASAPVFVSGLAAMHAAYGASPWEDLIAPAEDLARAGHRVSDALAADLASVSSMFARIPSVARVFSGLGGTMAPAGQTVTQPDLAEVLALVGSHGAAAITGGDLPATYAAAAGNAGFALPEEEVRLAEVAWAEPITVPMGGDQLALAPRDSAGGPEQARILQVLATGGGLDGLDDGARGQRLFDAQRQGLDAPGDAAAGATLAAIAEDGTAVACGFTLNGLFGTGHIASGTGIFIAGQPRPRTRVLGGLALVVNEPLNAALFAGGGADHTAALSVPLAESVLAQRPVGTAIATPRLAPDGSGGAVAEIGIDPAVMAAMSEAGVPLREVPVLGRGTAVACDREDSRNQTCHGAGDGRLRGSGTRTRT